MVSLTANLLCHLRKRDGRDGKTEKYERWVKGNKGDGRGNRRTNGEKDDNRAGEETLRQTEYE